jgi:hypothetical protein
MCSDSPQQHPASAGSVRENINSPTYSDLRAEEAVSAN